MEKPKNVLIHFSTSSLIKVVLIAGAVLLLYLLRDVALIVLASIVIASSVEPVIEWFLQRKVPRVITAVGTYAAISLFIAVIVYFVLPTLLIETSDVLVKLNQLNFFSGTTDAAAGSSLSLLGNASQMFSFNGLISAIGQVVQTVSGGVFATAGNIFGGAMSFLIIFILSFYFAVQDDGVADFLRVIVPPESQPYIIGLWKRSERKIGLWMQGQLFLGFVIGIFDFIGLTLLGVPYAFPLAVLAGLFEIVPVFGPIVAGVPGVAVALSVGGVKLAIAAAIFFTIIQQIESNFIYPIVVNKVVGLSPIIVIIALISGAKLEGILGAILAIPITAAIMEYYEDVKKDRERTLEKI